MEGVLLAAICPTVLYSPALLYGNRTGYGRQPHGGFPRALMVDCSHVFFLTVFQHKGRSSSGQCPPAFITPHYVVLASGHSRPRSSSACDASNSRPCISGFLRTGGARNPPQNVHPQARLTAFHRMAGMELRSGTEFLYGPGQVARASEHCAARVLEHLVCGWCKISSERAALRLHIVVSNVGRGLEVV